MAKKERNIYKEGAPKLTKEERKYMETMEPRTEYQERILNLDNEISELQKQKDKTNDLIRRESDSIAAIKAAIELSRGMAPEAKKAEEILENASKDIVGMLFDEAKQHIDEESEKNKAEADKKAEEKVEKEKAEMEKAEKEKGEEDVREAGKAYPGAMADAMLQECDEYIEKLKEIRNIMQKTKLLEEDVKGAIVDEQL